VYHCSFPICGFPFSGVDESYSIELITRRFFIENGKHKSVISGNFHIGDKSLVKYRIIKCVSCGIMSPRAPLVDDIVLFSGTITYAHEASRLSLIHGFTRNVSNFISLVLSMIQPVVRPAYVHITGRCPLMHASGAAISSNRFLPVPGCLDDEGEIIVFGFPAQPYF
jgi:hypothetical protein